MATRHISTLKRALKAQCNGIVRYFRVSLHAVANFGITVLDLIYSKAFRFKPNAVA